MKNKLILAMMAVAVSATLVTGCGAAAGTGSQQETSVEASADAGEAQESADDVQEEAAADVAASQAQSAEKEGTAAADTANASSQEAAGNADVDFTKDHEDDIRKEVEDAVASSASLQEEMENIEKISQKYQSMADAAQTQDEMNTSSAWIFKIWDTELNNLWSRFSDQADQQTKDEVLEEQENWISMKEEITLESIGHSEDHGSVYPTMYNNFQADITRNRVYILAGDLAKVKGESFTLPEHPAMQGVFADNEGTGSVYSSLCIGYGDEGDEAVVSVYRQGETDGTVVEKGNGELEYTSDDGNIKGIIRINGWDGASFEVTESNGQSGFDQGQVTEFPFAF